MGKESARIRRVSNVQGIVVRMKSMRKGEWRYAGLVMVLLVLAGVAGMLVVAEFGNRPAMMNAGPILEDMMLAVLALTTGLMFLAGGFGIWAIRTTSMVEGTQRVARFIEDMDYLPDGIILLDRRGRIQGMNRVAKVLAAVGSQAVRPALRDVFPCLTERDETGLLDAEAGYDVERVARRGHELYSLRFASQPSADLSIVQVRDVTAARTRQMKDRQVAHFQLIGRIARGVAHDFNNVLCSIAAHASLLDRPDSLTADDRESVASILQQSERGSDLADRLLRLTDMEGNGRPAQQLGHHLENAAELLRFVLPPLWTVDLDVIGSFPAVPLDGNQVEQILVNLGLEASQPIETPGRIELSLSPGAWGRNEPVQAIIDVAAHPPASDPEVVHSHRVVEVEDAGVIESVVRSVLEGVDGSMEIRAHHDGRHAYHLCIPTLSAARSRRTAEAGLRADLARRVQGWQVLLARPREAGQGALEQRLTALGIQLESATDLVVVLGRMETSFPFQAMILERRLLGDTAEALIAAMVKLQPATGLVVLCDEPEDEPDDLQRTVVFVAGTAGEDAVIRALIKAVDNARSRLDQEAPSGQT